MNRPPSFRLALGGIAAGAAAVVYAGLAVESGASGDLVPRLVFAFCAGIGLAAAGTAMYRAERMLMSQREIEDSTARLLRAAARLSETRAR